MDINWIRSLFTVWVFVSFALVLYIVFNRRNKKNYDDAASSIMEDDDTPHEKQ
ncbi:cbb3-type cytochrome oxidase subunit 3 [Neisseria sp.]|uniref:cbb3-type cytochrome oxidase subunit 3 n=1 Tax=Neisseria sp. TaxID=192066 RepID=UPI0035A0A642